MCGAQRDPEQKSDVPNFYTPDLKLPLIWTSRGITKDQVPVCI